MAAQELVRKLLLLKGAGILRNADCGMRKVVKGYFAENQVRNFVVVVVPLIAFPHSAAEKFRISASFTVELSFDDLIWLVYSRVF